MTDSTSPKDAANKLPKKAKRRAQSTRWAIGIAIIAVAVVGLAMTQISQTVVYFYTPDEAVAQASTLRNKTIKVGGMVVPGTVDWRAQELSLAFTISDLKGHEIRVSHKGTPPDMFKEGQGVVVEGLIAGDGKTMTAKKLFVKHSEEYKKPGDHATSVNKELLERSMFKEQYKEQLKEQSNDTPTSSATGNRP